MSSGSVWIEVHGEDSMSSDGVWMRATGRTACPWRVCGPRATEQTAHSVACVWTESHRVDSVSSVGARVDITGKRGSMD